MAVRLISYLSFAAEAAEAMTYYEGIFGGKLSISYFKDFGLEGPDGELVMHSELIAAAGFSLMAADSPASAGISVQPNGSRAFAGAQEDGLEDYWAALSKDGTVTQPLEKQMWGDSYGALTDKFGVQWQFNITSAENAAQAQG